MILVGTSKVNITPKTRDIGMFGWAMVFNTAKAVHTELFARAFYFENNKRFVYVVCDIGSISVRIHTEVAKILKEKYPELGLNEENIFLTATHTHSSPGGYSEYFLYLASIPGFSFEVFNTYVNGIVEAIVSAAKNKQEANLYYDYGDFPAEIPVAFNRRINAYNANKDVERVHKKDSHLAIDRRMYLLRIDSKEGKPLGSIAWFGVHATCVHNDKNHISSDNKGIASLFMEEHFATKNHDFVAAFPQLPAGDVSPNFIKHKGDKLERGVSPDDFKNAEINAKFHYDLAIQIHSKAVDSPLKNTELNHIMFYTDFSKIPIEEDLGGGFTAYPALGSSFLLGTREGPGVPWILERIVITIAALNGPIYDKQNHANKRIVINSIKRTLANKPIDKLAIPSIEPTLKILKKCGELNIVPKYSLTPYIMPLHIVAIGDIKILGAPTEITTVGGRRIKKYIAQLLNTDENNILVNPYSNGYAGYTTTEEEYYKQLYEGASTHFGPKTLKGIMSVYKRMLREINKEQNDRNYPTIKPLYASEEILKKMEFNILKKFRDS